MSSRKLFPWLIIALAIPVFMGQNCGIQSNDEKNPCSKIVASSLEKTLYSEREDTLREYFLHSGPAKSACHAHYILYFDRSQRKDRSHDMDSLPFSTTTAFRPGGMQGLLFFFPSPKPVLDRDGIPATWMIDFSIGNKNSASDTTDYTVYFYLPASSDDTISIKGTIQFSDF